MPRFNDLPLEIRRKIWKAIAFIPRTVDIWNKSIGIGYPEEGGIDIARTVHHRIVSRTPPPSILHVCRESREEARRHYTLSLGLVRDFGGFVVTSKPQVYINPAVDTICLLQLLNFFVGFESYYCPHVGSMFADALRDLNIKSLAVNIWGSDGDGDGDDEDIMIQGHLETDIIPKTIDIIEELILFSWDPESFEGRWGQLLDENVHLRELTHDELEDGSSTLLPSYERLNQYLTREWSTDGVESSKVLADYDSKKRLCRLNGGWLPVKPWDNI